MIEPSELWRRSLTRVSRNSHAWSAVCLLAILTTACGSSSNTFVAPAGTRCEISASASSTSFPPGGGSGTLAISAARECSWSLRSDASWVVPQEDARGQGDGSARFTVTGNGDPTARAAALNVGQVKVSISQEGTPCEFRISSTHESVDPLGGERTINVVASSAQCSWSTAADASWITLVGSPSQTGSGRIVIQVASSPGAPRSGTVTIAGQALSVEQGSACVAVPGTGAFNVAPDGGRLQLPILAPIDCTWSARSDDPWISIAQGQSGSGNGVVVLDIAAGTSRTGTITVGGRTVTIEQGAACTVTGGLTSTSISAAGGRIEVPVLATARCGWTSQSDAAWLSISSGANGTGAGTVVITVAATDGPLRTGSVTVAGVRVTITQLSGCRYDVQPTSYAAAPSGSGGNIALQTAPGCPWTAQSAASWITMGSLSGSGGTNVPFVVAANDGPARTGTLTVAGATITVAQDSPCSWSLAPPFADYGPDGGRGAVLVLVVGGCKWSASSTVGWVTIDTGQSGAGNGLVQFLVSPNAGTTRSGIVRIGGMDLIVRQQDR